MKSKISIFVAGMAFVCFGLIFHFQGKGQVGPTSSFMYANPDWIDYGMLISLIGSIIIIFGIIYTIKASRK